MDDNVAETMENTIYNKYIGKLTKDINENENNDEDEDVNEN